jgi:hypothetical protein
MQTVGSFCVLANFLEYLISERQKRKPITQLMFATETHKYLTKTLETDTPYLFPFQLMSKQKAI